MQLRPVGEREADPMWPMPLWPGYDEDLASRIADLNNVSSTQFAGSIIGALFLKRFVTRTRNWLHGDVYAWNPKERPGRPVGAEPHTVRALVPADPAALRMRRVDGAGRPAESLAAEAAFRREIAPWALLGLTLGLVEGATAAVLIKKTFAHAADPWIVNLAVAFVSGAPALSNVVSFVWANLAHGRARIGLMVALQAGFALLVGLVRRGAARARRTGLRRGLDSHRRA